MTHLLQTVSPGLGGSIRREIAIGRLGRRGVEGRTGTKKTRRRITKIQTQRAQRSPRTTKRGETASHRFLRLHRLNSTAEIFCMKDVGGKQHDARLSYRLKTTTESSRG